MKSLVLRALKGLCNYERTSEKKEKAAGECIRAEIIYCVSESVKEVRCEAEKEGPKLFQQSSGLQNCTCYFYRS